MMKTHKLILTASSDYFSNLFRTVPSGYPILCKDCASHSELNYLLDFMYKENYRFPKKMSLAYCSFPKNIQSKD